MSVRSEEPSLLEEIGAIGPVETAPLLQAESPLHRPAIPSTLEEVSRRVHERSFLGLRDIVQDALRTGLTTFEAFVTPFDLMVAGGIAGEPPEMLGKRAKRSITTYAIFSEGIDDPLNAVQALTAERPLEAPPEISNILRAFHESTIPMGNFARVALASATQAAPALLLPGIGVPLAATAFGAQYGILVASALDVSMKTGRRFEDITVGEASVNFTDRVSQKAWEVQNVFTEIPFELAALPTRRAQDVAKFIKEEGVITATSALLSVPATVSEIIGPELVAAHGVSALGRILRARKGIRVPPEAPPPPPLPEGVPRPPVEPTPTVGTLDFQPPPVTDTGKALQMELFAPDVVDAKVSRLEEIEIRLDTLVGSGPMATINNPTLDQAELRKVLDEADTLFREQEVLARDLSGDLPRLGEEPLPPASVGAMRGKESVEARLQLLREKFLRAERVIREGESPLYHGALTLGPEQLPLGELEVIAERGMIEWLPFATEAERKIHPNRPFFSRADITQTPGSQRNFMVRFITTREELGRAGIKVVPEDVPGARLAQGRAKPTLERTDRPVPLSAILKVEIDPSVLNQAKLDGQEEVLQEIIHRLESQGVPTVIKPLFLQTGVREFRPIEPLSKETRARALLPPRTGAMPGQIELEKAFVEPERALRAREEMALERAKRLMPEGIARPEEKAEAAKVTKALARAKRAATRRQEEVGKFIEEGLTGGEQFRVEPFEIPSPTKLTPEETTMIQDALVRTSEAIAGAGLQFPVRFEGGQTIIDRIIDNSTRLVALGDEPIEVANKLQDMRETVERLSKTKDPRTKQQLFLALDVLNSLLELRITRLTLQ